MMKNEISNEEAKRNLVYAKRWGDKPDDRALDAAIKALEQQPCEDCISREQAINEINKKVLCHTYEAREIIKNLPSITPQPKRGKWVWEIDEIPSTPVSSYELNYEGWVCNCCHQFPDDICEWDNLDEPPTYKFCPNCGADMREVEKKWLNFQHMKKWVKR